MKTLSPETHNQNEEVFYQVGEERGEIVEVVENRFSVLQGCSQMTKKTPKRKAKGFIKKNGKVIPICESKKQKKAKKRKQEKKDLNSQGAGIIGSPSLIFAGDKLERRQQTRYIECFSDNAKKKSMGRIERQTVRLLTEDTTIKNTKRRQDHRKLPWILIPIKTKWYFHHQKN